MKTFKEFLREQSKRDIAKHAAQMKKHAAEMELWPNSDPESGFASLRDMQKQSSWSRYDRQKYQLFVPKKKDPAVALRVSAAARAHLHKKNVKESSEEDMGILLTEETTPVLFDYAESPPGHNKPQNGFWTSSAIQRTGGTYTSDWCNFIKRQYPQWQTDYGYLFEIVDDPLVFSVERWNAETFLEWAEKHGKAPTGGHDYGHRDNARVRFPWNLLPRYFDGAHHDGYSSDSDSFARGWDVESTVWFKTKFLKYRGAVKLYYAADHDEEDDSW